MRNKDVYDYLSKVYLDTSSKLTKEYLKNFKKLFFLITLIVFVFIIFLFTFLKEKGKLLNYESSLVLCPDTVKINFQLYPAKKEIYSVNLNRLNLSGFNALGFSVRRNNYKDKISLRVEFTNTFKEKSEVYFKDIPYRWQDYRVSFFEFKNVKDWSEMVNLSFIIEEWNTIEKNGAVYIDNIRFLR